MKSRDCIVLGFLGMLITIPPARGFVCSRVSRDLMAPSLSWPHRVIPYTLNQRGTRQLERTATFATLRRAFAVWQQLQLKPAALSLCESIELSTDIFFEETPLSAEENVGYDFIHREANLNLLVFRDTKWLQKPSLQDGALALTTTTFNALDGSLLDADIEFNSNIDPFVCQSEYSPSTAFKGVCFALPGQTKKNPHAFDLLNTAVHEIGHFLGINHCNNEKNSHCNNDSVMYSLSKQGEIDKTLLGCDDAKAVAFKYPANQRNGYCSANQINAACGFCAPPADTYASSKSPMTTTPRHTGCQSIEHHGMISVWLLLLLYGIFSKTSLASCKLASRLKAFCKYLLAALKRFC